jgi:hypothetical protein
MMLGSLSRDSQIASRIRLRSAKLNKNMNKN